jgi:hypothetical protein
MLANRPAFPDGRDQQVEDKIAHSVPHSLMLSRVRFSTKSPFELQASPRRKHYNQARAGVAPSGRLR